MRSAIPLSALVRAGILALAATLGACHLDDLLGGEGVPSVPSDSTPGDGEPATASRLVFSVQPAVTTAGERVTPAVEVNAVDPDGAAVPAFTGVVSITLAANPSGATLGGVTAQTAVGGVARFPDLSIALPAQGYTLRATGSGLAADTSNPFDVLDSDRDGDGAIPATVEQVSGDAQVAPVGSALRAPFVVRVVDADGNGVAGVSVKWTADGGGSISPATSLTDAEGLASAVHTLGPGAGTQTTDAAVAVPAGSPVTFTATAVPDVPAQLVFSVQPGHTGVGRRIRPPVEVSVQDRFGNRVTNFAGSITMDITPGTSTIGASLSGTRTRPVNGGVATFNDLRIHVVGVNYRLRATGAGLLADSRAFNVLL